MAVNLGNILTLIKNILVMRILQILNIRIMYMSVESTLYIVNVYCICSYILNSYFRNDTFAICILHVNIII